MRRPWRRASRGEPRPLPARAANGLRGCGAGSGVTGRMAAGEGPTPDAAAEPGHRRVPGSQGWDCTPAPAPGPCDAAAAFAGERGAFRVRAAGLAPATPPLRRARLGRVAAGMASALVFLSIFVWTDRERESERARAGEGRRAGVGAGSRPPGLRALEAAGAVSTGATPRRRLQGHPVRGVGVTARPASRRRRGTAWTRAFLSPVPAEAGLDPFYTWRCVEGVEGEEGEEGVEGEEGEEGVVPTVED